ncbi:hypothetical protein Nmar_1161 [Nitrosopumilus maritimus SCM1]|uniref:Blue (Type 1) copper domain protein n=2 Tax=Nitrosopumilus maritimus TaxID=338192 RepID=A9A5Q2_NITMS|nr:hypothetical protein Nmar_1161 [Nitrosopumilus maritimus SCM1]
MKIKDIKKIMYSHDYHEFHEYSYTSTRSTPCLHLTYLVLAFALIIPSFAYAQESGDFPNWYTEFVIMWTERQIADDEFILSTEYLANQNLISVPLFDPTSPSAGIPDWIKNTADWWTDGIVSDSEFLSSLEFLVDTNVIKKTSYQSDSLFDNFTIDVEKLENGEKVTWTSKDSLSHTITSGTPAKHTPLFSSGIIHKGESVSYVLENGVYSFFCMIHPWETETLTVPVALENYQTAESDFPDSKTEETTLEQKQEEHKTLQEKQAKKILANFGSTSLNIVSVSNSDGQLHLEYMEEFFTRHIDQFNPQIVENIKLMENDPEKYLDLALADAGLSREFYSGQISIWGEIFKVKSENLDQQHVRSLEEMQSLDLEDSKKEYYVAEINKAKQTFDDMLESSGLTMIQPLEEKITKSEHSDSSKGKILESNLSENDHIGRIIATISDFITSLLYGIKSLF